MSALSVLLLHVMCSAVHTYHVACLLSLQSVQRAEESGQGYPEQPGRGVLETPQTSSKW